MRCGIILQMHILKSFSRLKNKMQIRKESSPFLFMMLMCKNLQTTLEKQAT